MPWASKRACPHQPCPHFRPCPVHVDEAPYRGSATAQGYGVQWRRTRDRILAQRGARCVDCGTTRGTFDVDHITSRKRGGTDDPSNLAVRCHACHASKTARVDGGKPRR